MSASGGGGSNTCGILANLGRLIQSVVDDSEAELEAIGLSAKAFFLLEAVEEHPFPAMLARRMHLPPPTVTYLVKGLEEKGFLGRQAEPADLRRFRLVVTDAGHEALRRGRDALNGALHRRLDRLGREDVVTFDRIVGRLAGQGEAPASKAE
jgi:DNA-binding MarR family transcriptional regulator